MLQLLVPFIVTTRCQSVIWLVGEVSSFDGEDVHKLIKNHTFTTLGRVFDTGKTRQRGRFSP